MTDITRAVKTFTEASAQTTKGFNTRQTAMYLGLAVEELLECFDACGLGKSLPALAILSSELKSGAFDSMIEKADRIELADGCADLAWVAIGCGFSQGADMQGVIDEVARSNMEKLSECEVCDGSGIHPKFMEECPICDGKGLIAIKDMNGKIVKPESWSTPNLESFICKE